MADALHWCHSQQKHVICHCGDLGELHSDQRCWNGLMQGVDCGELLVQVQLGLIWVWPESGPHAFIESSAKEPALNQRVKEVAPGGHWQSPPVYVVVTILFPTGHQCIVMFTCVKST